MKKIKKRSTKKKKKINQKDLKWMKQLMGLFKIMRVARKVLEPALDFIRERRKQELPGVI